MIALMLVLGWIALGCFTMRWLIDRREDGTDVLFIIFLLVYFGAPIPLVGLLR